MRDPKLSIYEPLKITVPKEANKILANLGRVLKETLWTKFKLVLFLCSLELYKDDGYSLTLGDSGTVDKNALWVFKKSDSVNRDGDDASICLYWFLKIYLEFYQIIEFS